MKKLKSLAFVFVVLSVIEFSCSKGSTGPQGPAGPAGSGNVTYSPWIQLNMTFEGADTVGDSLYSESLSASALTSSILDSGVILSYIGVLGSGSSGTDTAVFSVSEASTYFGPLTQEFLPDEIDLLSYYNYSYSNGFLYRFVTIPGNVLTTNSVLKSYTKEQLKHLDYLVVSKALGVSTTGSKTSN